MNPAKAQFNNLGQCWGCKNQIGAHAIQPIKNNMKLPYAVYPECKATGMIMCEVYSARCQSRKPEQEAAT